RRHVPAGGARPPAHLRARAPGDGVGRVHRALSTRPAAPGAGAAPTLRANRRGPAPDRAGGGPRPPWRLAPRVLPGGLSEVTEQGPTPQELMNFLLKALCQPRL